MGEGKSSPGGRRCGINSGCDLYAFFHFWREGLGVDMGTCDDFFKDGRVAGEGVGYHQVFFHGVFLNGVVGAGGIITRGS